jgi:hypothetical protein
MVSAKSGISGEQSAVSHQQSAIRFPLALIAVALS